MTDHPERDLLTRRDFVKRAGKLAAGGLMLGSSAQLLAACGQGAASATDAARIGKIADLLTSSANVFAQTWHRGVNQAARELEIDSFLLEESGDGTGDLQQAIANVQISFLRDASMVTGYLSGGAVLPGLAQAVGENDMVLAYAWNERPWFTPLDAGKHWVNFLTPDNGEVGRLIATTLFDAMGGEGGIVAITGSPGSGSAERRTLGLEQAVEENPGIELLGRQIGNYNRTDSRQAMDQLLTANSGIGGVWAANDDTAIGAIGALEDRNMADDVPVVGTDANQEALDLMKAGRYAGSYSPHAAWMSGFCVVNAFDAVNGWEPRVPERMLYNTGLVVTPENVDAYYKLLYGRDDLPVDFRKMSRTLNPDSWDPQVELVPIDPNQLWNYVPKPESYSLPEEYAEAESSGEFEEVAQLYAERYQDKVFEV